MNNNPNHTNLNTNDDIRQPEPTTEIPEKPKPEQPVKSNVFLDFFSKLKARIFKPKTTTENVPPTNDAPKMGGKRKNKNRRTKKNKKSKSVKSRK
jgi:hypothetical protein